MSSREDDAQQADLKFERGIMTHVIGTLLAWGLGLLAYMMFVLWQDYISTILTSFIVAQTLHKQQAQLVGLIRLLRHPNEQSLLQAALGVIRRPIRGLQWIVFDVPALLQLALLLVVLIVQGMHTWVRIGLYLAGPAAALLLAIFLFDKKLLRFNAVVSDEARAITRPPLPAPKRCLCCVRTSNALAPWSRWYLSCSATPPRTRATPHHHTPPSTRANPRVHGPSGVACSGGSPQP